VSRRDIVMVRGLLRAGRSKTAFVKRGADKVRLHGRWFRKTEHVTDAGIPVYEPMEEINHAE